MIVFDNINSTEMSLFYISTLENPDLEYVN